MTLTFGVLQAIAMFAGPLALALLLRTKWRVSWGLFGFGALAFLSSKLVQLPVAALLDPHMPSDLWVRLPLVLLMAPLCEESARWICFRYWTPRARSWREGLFVGLGHGGFESIALGVVGAMALAGALTVSETSADAT